MKIAAKRRIGLLAAITIALIFFTAVAFHKTMYYFDCATELKKYSYMSDPCGKSGVGQYDIYDSESGRWGWILIASGLGALAAISITITSILFVAKPYAKYKKRITQLIVGSGLLFLVSWLLFQLTYIESSSMGQPQAAFITVWGCIVAVAFFFGSIIGAITYAALYKLKQK